MLVAAKTVPMVSAANSFSIAIAKKMLSSLILIAEVAEPPVVKNSETFLSTVRN